MLEQLFGSKTRSRLLKIFLMNPEKAFFIRELTRMIDTQINSVRRELDNLSHCGIIKAVSSADGTVLVGKGAGDTEQQNDSRLRKPKSIKKEKVPKKYFMANSAFILFKELSQLLKRSPLLFQERFITDIRSLDGIDYAIMTGFFVDTADAPVDLLIVGGIQRQRLTKLITHYEKEFEREINYTTMTTDEFLYRKSLTDRFLSRILDGKKIVVLDSLQAVRA